MERPASALKEILENSLDAGCRKIEVLLRDGGMSEITVIDDGRGIHPEDLALCLERHATSKIHRSEDLEAISTYGFRGEALASISSVAQVEIKSRPAGADHAMAMTLSFGEVTQPPRPVGAPQGTSLTVRDLFAQIPARKKFLRSPNTEFSHCARIVKELAVGNPHVHFSLHHNGRQVCAYAAPTRASRIQEAFHWDWHPLHVDQQTDGLALEAFLTPGDHTQDRGEILLYINQRAVRNRGLLSAVRQAYLSTLGPHHEPSGVVYLDIQKDWVDVNVHPQKTEVRCLRQESLYSWILATLRKAISCQPSVRPISTLPLVQSPTPASVPFVPQNAFTPPPRPASFVQTDLENLTKESEIAPSDPPRIPTAPPVRKWRYLGQAKAAYLICEDAQGILLVDQHALHEKHRFEELMRKLETEGLKSQRLLLPRILRLPSELTPILEENLDSLARLGFEIESFGDGDWALKAIPELLSEAQCETVVLETLHEIRKSEQSAGEVAARAVRPVLATLACHSVVRAGQALSAFEAETLLSRFEDLEMGWTCPHGRPVAFRLGFGEIEKHFERK